MLGRFRATETSSRNEVTRKSRGAARTPVAVFVFAIFAVLVIPVLASAQVDLGLEYATSLGLTTTDIRITIGRIINAFLGFLGLVAVIIMLYAGFIWMTSGGNPEKVNSAKRMMINGVIGLTIILSAFAIVQFIIRAITGTFPIDIGGTSGSQPQSLASFQSGNSSALGNGIIEYHYPEPGQVDVPRNTTISITFKRPLVLSSIFKDYDDKGTFDTADDVFTPPLLLNTDNVKIIANQALEAPGSGSMDEQFDARYVNAIIDPNPLADVTQVSLPFDPAETQTVVIIPPVLGSPTTDVTYRVAIRGGENGVKVWTPDPDSGNPVLLDAFNSMTVDGGYFWPFATGTTLDLSPPYITAVVPRVRVNPGSKLVDRNQLLQIYFNEGVDPTTASGILGPMGGFTNIEVQARCLVGPDCDWGGGDTSSFTTIPGTIVLGNKYRTAEFKPSAPCEGVTENSCGETVYCLPKNVELRVRTKAATLSDEPPRADIIRDGVVDLAMNSFDGNHNGTTEGPVGVGRPDDFLLNDPQADLSTVSDTAAWFFHVGENIDLIPPVIMSIDPVSPPPPEVSHPAGPSKVPPDFPPTILWSKVMSIGSMLTGAFDEDTGDWADQRTTVAIRSKECEKENRLADCATEGCPCDDLDPPNYFIDVGTGPIEVAGEDRTEMKLPHRIFFNADDLGYTEEDIAFLPDRIPLYQPVVRAQIRDSKQNCFYPSEGFECTGVNVFNPSCCNRTAQGTYVCPL